MNDRRLKPDCLSGAAPWNEAVMRSLGVVLIILCAGHRLLAQGTNSNVIHLYSYVNLSGGYVPAHGNIPALAGTAATNQYYSRLFAGIEFHF